MREEHMMMEEEMGVMHLGDEEGATSHETQVATSS